MSVVEASSKWGITRRRYKLYVIRDVLTVQRKLVLYVDNTG